MRGGLPPPNKTCDKMCLLSGDFYDDITYDVRTGLEQNATMKNGKL